MGQKDKIYGINADEQESLKKRISTSIFKYQHHKRNVRYIFTYASAAVLIFFISGIYFYNTQTSSLENYIEMSNTVIDHNNDKVTLVLEEGKSVVDIDGENSNIIYSNTGEKVIIDRKDELNQTSTKNNEVVYNTLIVPYGKRSQISLADGTKVWLNSGSKLVYPVIFNKNVREVYIEGEGIFDVAHNEQQPFKVLSKNHEIEVLGTLFNVSNYQDDDDIGTTLKSGSVQIRYKADSFFNRHKVLKISPGTRAVYGRNSNTIHTKEVDTEKYFSWRNGVFIFKKDNLKHIMKKLSRYYNVEITVNNKELEDETFSGYLDLKDNVDNVIQIIKETSDFEYTMNNNQISIN